MTVSRNEHDKIAPQPTQLLITMDKAQEMVERVGKILAEKGFKYRQNSSVSSLFSSIKKLNNTSKLMSDHKYRSEFLKCTNAIQVAQSIELAIADPHSKLAIQRILSSNMNFYDRRLSPGKDALWELDLFRRLKLGNVQVRFEEPDLVVYLGEGFGDYAIACKKTYSQSSVEKAFHKGLEQLKKHNKPGVVAFNLDDLNLGDPVWQERQSSSVYSRLNEINTTFIRKNEKLFRKAEKLGCCDGVIVSTSVMSEVLESEHRITLFRLSAAFKIGREEMSIRRFNEFTTCLDKVLNK
ncbi:hypothetical protein [Aeromonas hydrophila]|uniref:hypothetical protein n=1 Tax=Aeromonas hydrophila TaxID=644 RepID=UPI003EC6E09F